MSDADQAGRSVPTGGHPTSSGQDGLSLVTDDDAASTSRPDGAPLSRAEKRAAVAERQRATNTRLAPIIPTSVPWKAVTVFLVTAIGLAWLVELPIWLSGDGLTSPLFFPLTAVMMFTPTVAAFVAVLVVHRPRSIPRMLGLAPLRPLGRTLGLSALVLVVMPVLTFAAMLLGQALGLTQLDLVGLSGFTELLGSQGAPVPDRSMVVILAIVSVLTLPLVGMVNAVAAFGEELGWRGWLLPALLPLGTGPALVLTGAVWGLWHTPLILLGYNYGVTDITGVLQMVVWCILLGIVIGWTRLRTTSVWPAVFAHGAVNASVSTLLVTFAAAGSNDRSSVQGSLLGAPGWIVLAVVIGVLVVTGQFRRRPEPGLTLAESRKANARHTG